MTDNFTVTRRPALPLDEVRLARDNARVQAARARRRRALTLGLATLVFTAVATPLAAVTFFTEPEVDFGQDTGTVDHNVEPTATSASVIQVSGTAANGVTWSLSSYKSDQGLCLSLASSASKGRAEACSLTLSKLSGTNYLTARNPPARQTLIGGIAEPRAEFVNLTLSNGQVIQAATTDDQSGGDHSDGLTLRYFAVLVPDTVQVVDAVVTDLIPRM